MAGVVSCITGGNARRGELLPGQTGGWTGPPTMPITCLFARLAPCAPPRPDHPGSRRHEDACRGPATAGRNSLSGHGFSRMHSIREPPGTSYSLERPRRAHHCAAPMYGPGTPSGSSPHIPWKRKPHCHGVNPMAVRQCKTNGGSLRRRTPGPSPRHTGSVPRSIPGTSATTGSHRRPSPSPGSPPACTPGA